MAGQWLSVVKALSLTILLLAAVPAVAQDDDADWDESEDAFHEDADSAEAAEDEATTDDPEADAETEATPPGSAGGQAAAQPEIRGKACRYRSTISGHVYDPKEGDPSAGIPPGTAFEDLPDAWVDPESGASKADFEKVCD